MRRRLAFALSMLPFLASVAAAHNFWIEPSTYRRATPGPVTFALRVGVGFDGDPVPRDKSRIERFLVASPSRDNDVVGRDGDDPAGSLRLEEEGLHVVAYRSLRRAITLDAQKFEAYLAEEGLEHVIAWRKEHGESEKDGVETYSRAVKSFVRVGAQGADAKPSANSGRVFGFPFELVPEREPLSVKGGESLVVKALVDGKPAEGVLVGALRKGDPKDAAAARTGADGRVELKLDRPGVWLVHAVQMRRAPAETKADWESIWASLTFEVVAPTSLLPPPAPGGPKPPVTPATPPAPSVPAPR